MSVLADHFDLLLVDLDGTIYLGAQAVPHAAPALRRAGELGAPSIYVTNNASRGPAEVAATLAKMGVSATQDDILTSPQVAAKMLAAVHQPGARVLVIGAPALADAVSEVGLLPVRLATEQPVALVQGHSPDTGWRDLAEGCIALRAGVDWVACNTDTTLPTDRGLLPGNGAMVQVLVAATGLHPRVAGKPNRPLLDEAVRRTGAKRPLVIGDRLDTDIEAGVAADLPSLLVLSGVSTAADLLLAPKAQRPTYLAFDLRGLVDENLAVALDSDAGGWSVETIDRALVLSRPASNGGSPQAAAAGGDSDHDALAALAALARCAWSSPDQAFEIRGADERSTTILRRLRLIA